MTFLVNNGEAGSSVRGKINELISFVNVSSAVSLSPVFFGAKGDGATDDTLAIQTALQKASAMVFTSAAGAVVVDGFGLTYGVTDTLTILTGVKLQNIALSALVSSNWVSGKKVVSIPDGAFTVTVDTFRIYGNQIAAVGLHCIPSGTISITNGLVRGCLEKQLWVSGSVVMDNVRAGQFTAAQLVTGTITRTAYTLYCDDKATDSKFINCGFQPGLVPVHIAEDVHHLQFIGVHMWNQTQQAGATPLTRSLNVECYGYAIQFVGCYLDLGAIYYKRLTGTQQPDLLFSGCTTANNQTAAPFPSWIIFDTEVADTNLRQVHITSDNRWAGVTAVPILSLETSGAGTWQVTNAAALSTTDSLITVRNSLSVLSSNETNSDVLRLIPATDACWIELANKSGVDDIQLGRDGDGAFSVQKLGQTTFKVNDDGDSMLRRTVTGDMVLRFVAPSRNTIEIGQQTDAFTVKVGSNKNLTVNSTREILAASSGAFGFDNGPRIYSDNGSPEGVVIAPIGSLFLRKGGGAGSTLYVKESGTGNTGWVAK